MKKIYIQSDSIRSLMKKLKQQTTIIGVEYNVFNPNGYETFHSIYDLEVNDVVAIYKDPNTKTPYEWLKWNGLTLIKSL
tara:strand:- start:3 stop:239 length:237 start_codon:yes stop_codon:yes gene_type:complete